MTGKQRLRKGLIRIFWVSLFFTLGFTWYYMQRRVPDHLNLVEGEWSQLDLELPVRVSLMSESKEVVLGNASNIPSEEIRISTDEQVSFFASSQGSYQVNLKLFGTIPFKEIQVNVVDCQYAIPCGVPVGIYLKANGVMVVGTGKITDENGEEIEPAFGVLQSGDYIEAINGTPLKDKEALITNLNHLEGEEAVLRIRREGASLDIPMRPIKTQEGSYKLGAWVRDDTQGIGTMTYLDGNNKFGALGHGISDSDTGQLVEISQGALYETEILGIEKGSIGNPGIMAGVIYYGPGTKLGTITDNTTQGIFGTADEKIKEAINREPIPVGYRQDVKKGQAWIRSNVSGELRDYEIEIQKVNYNPIQENKSLVVKITDPELLSITGGIVQGMSGSPIIQDGKLVGAVTHVFVQDSTRGYGIFVEDMIEH